MQPTPQEIERGVQFARNREAARKAHWEKQAQRASGVSYGAYFDFTPMTEAQIEREGLEWAHRFAKSRAEQGRAA